MQKSRRDKRTKPSKASKSVNDPAVDERLGVWFRLKGVAEEARHICGICERSEKSD